MRRPSKGEFLAKLPKIVCAVVCFALAIVTLPYVILVVQLVLYFTIGHWLPHEIFLFGGATVQSLVSPDALLAV